MLAQVARGVGAVAVRLANGLGAISLPGQGAAFVAAGTAFMVDIAVSVLATAEPVSELRGLVFSETPKQLRTDPAATRLLLRARIDRYGAAGDRRLSRTFKGRPFSSSAYSDVWQEARRAFTAEQVASRPYDLCHAAVFLWLNAGVPATEVAKRAGHGVDVLLRVYAKCVEGQRSHADRRISDALGNRSFCPVPKAPELLQGLRRAWLLQPTLPVAERLGWLLRPSSGLWRSSTRCTSSACFPGSSLPQISPPVPNRTSI